MTRIEDCLDDVLFYLNCYRNVSFRGGGARAHSSVDGNELAVDWLASRAGRLRDMKSLFTSVVRVEKT